MPGFSLPLPTSAPQTHPKSVLYKCVIIFLHRGEWRKEREREGMREQLASCNLRRHQRRQKVDYWSSQNCHCTFKTHLHFVLFIFPPLTSLPWFTKAIRGDAGGKDEMVLDLRWLYFAMCQCCTNNLRLLHYHSAELSELLSLWAFYLKPEKHHWPVSYQSRGVSTVGL